MARSEARLQFGMWRRGLEGHSAHAKLLYAVLLTEATINQAGIGAIRVSRWAKDASLTSRETEKALGELSAGDPMQAQVLLDEDTEEVFVRTLIRNDRVADQPYVLKGALREALQTQSPLLRRVLAAELRKLPRRQPDGVAKNGRAIIYPDPHAVADLLDPLPESPKPSPAPSPNPSETLSGGTGDPFDTHPKGTSHARVAHDRAMEGEGEGVSTVGLDSPSGATRPKPPRADVEALCKHLQDRIIANGSKHPTKSAATTWRDEARRLLDIDKRDLAEAHRLIDWCQEDHFWRSNILGMPKFRKQYDAIRLQAGNRNHLWSVPPPIPSDPTAAFEDLRRRGDAQAVANLLHELWIEPAKPLTDPTPIARWQHARAVEWIDARRDQVLAALTRETG